MFKNRFFKGRKNKKKQGSKNRFTEIPADEQSIGSKDYEGIEANEDEIFAEEAQNFESVEEFAEDVSSITPGNNARE